MEQVNCQARRGQGFFVCLVHEGSSRLTKMGARLASTAGMPELELHSH